MAKNIYHRGVRMKKLLLIQSELKAPKGQFNNFGKYKYRSCEDIVEAVKPLLKNHDCLLTISDELVNIGERYYIKATAKITDLESKESEIVTGYAREEEVKKGMDGSQITGASSSYARKYALNGLFAIDDTKDSDSTNKHDGRSLDELKIILKEYDNKKELEQKKVILRDEFVSAGLTKKAATDLILEKIESLNGNS